MSTQVLNTTIYSYFGSGALSTGCAANVLLTILVVICFVIIKKDLENGRRRRYETEENPVIYI